MLFQVCNRNCKKVSAFPWVLKSLRREIFERLYIFRLKRDQKRDLKMPFGAGRCRLYKFLFPAIVSSDGCKVEFFTSYCEVSLKFLGGNF